MSDGVWSITGDSTFDYVYTGSIPVQMNDLLYCYASVKADSSQIEIMTTQPYKASNHSGSGTFELLSFLVVKQSNELTLQIGDRRSSGWTPVEIDYIGAFNITDLVNRGILPSGLTNLQYKDILDNAIYNNVPLRESDFISVEPSKAYKLIKVSANEVTHKVIEYTTDNQVVKVTPVVYMTNKFTFTTHALTNKVKLISDLMDRVPNLVSNSDLLIDSNSDGVPDGFTYANATDITLINGIAKYTATAPNGRLFHRINNNSGDIIYAFANFKVTFTYHAYANVRLEFDDEVSIHSGSGQFEYLSMIKTTTLSNRVVIVSDARTGATGHEFSPIEIDYIGAINITEFKDKGVKDDNGTLFSRLTNDEIKDQMDLWVQNGFPDHVIAALYPDGVDSAIALKYNDADDIFRPQQIDELPLNLTLRSGEYWQDGYVVKQNGNAEYHPLQTKFSA